MGGHTKAAQQRSGCRLRRGGVGVEDQVRFQQDEEWLAFADRYLRLLHGRGGDAAQQLTHGVLGSFAAAKPQRGGAQQRSGPPGQRRRQRHRTAIDQPGLHGLLHIKRRVGVGVAMLVVVGRYRRDGCRQQTVFATRSVDARQGLLLAGRGLSATVSIYTIVFQVDQRKRSWVGNFPADYRRQRAPAGRAIQKQLAESGIRRRSLPQIRPGQAANDAARRDGSQLLAATGQRQRCFQPDVIGQRNRVRSGQVRGLRCGGPVRTGDVRKPHIAQAAVAVGAHVTGRGAAVLQQAHGLGRGIFQPHRRFKHKRFGFVQRVILA